MAERLGVFGGTFDPVHVGHLAIARTAVETVPLDRVLFVVARRSPLKDRSPQASEADRVAMLRLAVSGEPAFAVSTLELERAGPSYTVDTLEQLARSGASLFLILGGDAFAALGGWQRAERIREIATILVAARPGAPEPAGARPLDAPRLDLSSRELRARASRGRSLRYLVPDTVWRYIEERGLYRAGEPGPRTS